MAAPVRTLPDPDHLFVRGAQRRRQSMGTPSAWMVDTIPWVTGVRRFPTRRLNMDEVEFHREPPSNIPTMVTAFSGWIDAGEAATDAMRFLVRQLPGFRAMKENIHWS